MADLTIVDAEVQEGPEGITERGVAGELIYPGAPVYYFDEDDVWYNSYSNGGSQSADVNGIALSYAPAGRRVSIQTDGRIKLGSSAGIVVGTSYGLSSTPGKIAPLGDVKITDYRTLIGVGDTNGILEISLHPTGILPGAMLNNFLLKWVFAVRVTNNTPQVSPIIAREGYGETTFHFNIGTIVDADATFAVLLEGGNVADLSDAVAVDDADMISQTIGVAPELAASWNASDDGEVRKLGYRNNIDPYPYLRLTVTPALNTGNADFSCVCVLGAPPATPVTQTAA